MVRYCYFTSLQIYKIKSETEKDCLKCNETEKEEYAGYMAEIICSYSGSRGHIAR